MGITTELEWTGVALFCSRSACLTRYAAGTVTRHETRTYRKRAKINIPLCHERTGIAPNQWTILSRAGEPDVR